MVLHTETKHYQEDVQAQPPVFCVIIVHSLLVVVHAQRPLHNMEQGVQTALLE